MNNPLISTDTLSPRDQKQAHHLSNYRADIDGLRAIAVMAVVGYHAFPTTVRGGFIGVDIFFVISGYLISGIIFQGLRRDRFSFVEFYSRRIRRIFPALGVVLATCLLVGWFTLLGSDYRALGKHVAGGAAFISNLLLLNEASYFDKLAETKPLLHLWSLGVEEQFYLIWPLAAWIAWKRKVPPVLLIAATLCASFLFDILSLSDRPSDTFYSPLTRVWELMLGALTAALAADSAVSGNSNVAEAVTHAHSLTYQVIFRIRAISAVLGLLLIGTALALINDTTPFPGWWTIFPTLGTALVITGGPHAWVNRHVMSKRILVWVGTISYPLYLWHWPILSLSIIQRGELPPRMYRAAAVALAFTLAWLTYQVVERPIRFGSRRNRTSVALLGTLTAVALAGLDVYAHHGYPSRWPAFLQQIADFETINNTSTAWREKICFLEIPDQGYESFAQCDKPADRSGPRAILLWGDSHAAQLYPGLTHRFGGHFAVIERTGSSCAPIIGDPTNLPACQALNAAILKEAVADRPGRVILASRWAAHDWPKLEATIAQLRAAGISNIDIVGPVPNWKISLPRQLVNFAKQHKVTRFDALPIRMSFGLNPAPVELESQLRSLAARAHARYISPIDLMCAADGGCIVRTADTVPSITAIDWDHLSAPGSDFLVDRFPDDSARDPGQPSSAIDPPR